MKSMIAKNKEAAIKVLKDLIAEHHSDVFTEGKVVHNQAKLTTLISLYTNSKYEDQPDDDSGVVFYNILNKDLDNTNKKTDLDRKNLTLYINDKALNFLLNAANNEFKDDYNMGVWLNRLKEDYNKYGTAVTKTKYISKKESVVEVIPWGSIICNPNNWDAAPQGIVKEVRLQEVLDNSLYDTAELEEALNENYDGANVISYELHGNLKNGIMSGDDNDIKRTNQQHIYLSIPSEFLTVKDKNNPEGKIFLIASAEEKDNPLNIIKRREVTNRTMGRGVIELGIDAQVISNEVANLMIDELRAIAKIVRWSDDEELDGVDVGEIDNNTVLNIAPGKKFGQLQANTVAFGELQNYIAMWGVQNQDESGTQDVSLGKQEKSGTPYKSTLLRKGEADSIHDMAKEDMELFIEMLYKDKILNIVIDYFDTKKSITDLLMGEQLNKFYLFLADRLAEKKQVELVLNRETPIEDRQLLVNMILGQIADTEFNIVDFDKTWDKKNIIDKARVRLAGENKDVDAKIQMLTSLHAQVAQNPGAYPNLDANDLLSQIVALSDSETLVDLFKQKQQTPQPMDNQAQINQQ